MANNAFIVLPILVERSKALLRERGLLNRDGDAAAEVLVPILFNFPNAGRLLTLLFVPFAAWLAGDMLSARDYSTLFAAGIPSYFAKAQVALPFLLDLFAIPHDIFQLYIPTTILTGKFDALVAAMNLLVFALLGGAAAGGFLVRDRQRLMRAGAAMLGGTALVVVSVSLLLKTTVDTSYHKDEALRRMHAPQALTAAVVSRDPAAVPEDPAAKEGSTLQRVRRRGTLRVGYDPSNLPFSFVNADGELVGFDVQLSMELARALAVKAEFVPIDWKQLPAMLADGTIDVMPGVWYRPHWFGSLRLSAPYLTGTMALAVRDERRREFARVEDLRQSRGLKVGIPLDRRQVESSMRRYFGDAEVEFITLDFWRPFFEGQHPELDAFLLPAENGSAWTLLHPEYTMVVPQPDPVKVPSAFGVALYSEDLVSAIDEWVVFASSEGAIDRAYDYWVLGKGAEHRGPRWSILRNVLGWTQ